MVTLRVGFEFENYTFHSNYTKEWGSENVMTRRHSLVLSVINELNKIKIEYCHEPFIQRVIPCDAHSTFWNVSSNYRNEYGEWIDMRKSLVKYFVEDLAIG